MLLLKDQISAALYAVDAHAKAWKEAWIQSEPDLDRLQRLRADLAQRIAPLCARLPLDTLANMARVVQVAVDELEDDGKCPAVDTSGIDEIVAALERARDERCEP